MKLFRVGPILLLSVFLTSCATNILKDIPAGGSVAHNEVVYAENDGRCKNGEVIKIIGGNDNKQIPRKYSCIARP